MKTSTLLLGGAALVVGYFALRGRGGHNRIAGEGRAKGVPGVRGSGDVGIGSGDVDVGAGGPRGVSGYVEALATKNFQVGCKYAAKGAAAAYCDEAAAVVGKFYGVQAKAVEYVGQKTYAGAKKVSSSIVGGGKKLLKKLF